MKEIYDRIVEIIKLLNELKEQNKEIIYLLRHLKYK